MIIDAYYVDVDFVFYRVYSTSNMTKETEEKGKSSLSAEELLNQVRQVQHGGIQFEACLDLVRDGMYYFELEGYREEERRKINPSEDQEEVLRSKKSIVESKIALNDYGIDTKKEGTPGYEEEFDRVSDEFFAVYRNVGRERYQKLISEAHGVLKAKRNS